MESIAKLFKRGINPMGKHGYSFVVAIMFLLSGCNGNCVDNTPFTLPTGAILAKVDKSLLTQVPCAPPCWEGIKPNETLSSAAHEIVAKLGFVDPNTVITANYVDGSTAINWHSAVSDYPYSIGAVNINQNGLVSSIVIHQLEYELTLNQVIQLYGNPSGVFISMSPPEAKICYTVTMAWPQHGMTLILPSFTAETVKQNPHPVQPDTSIAGVIFNPGVPSMTEYIQEYRGGSGGYIPWTGYDAITIP